MNGPTCPDPYARDRSRRTLASMYRFAANSAAAAYTHFRFVPHACEKIILDSAVFRSTSARETVGEVESWAWWLGSRASNRVADICCENNHPPRLVAGRLSEVSRKQAERITPTSHGHNIHKTHKITIPTLNQHEHLY